MKGGGAEPSDPDDAFVAGNDFLAEDAGDAFVRWIRFFVGAFFFAAMSQPLLPKISIARATCTASGAPQPTATHIHQG